MQVASGCWQTLSSILNHLQGWGAVAEVAVVEVRCPVILACRQEDLLPFEPPCTHVWTSSSLLSAFLHLEARPWGKDVRIPTTLHRFLAIELPHPCMYRHCRGAACAEPED